MLGKRILDPDGVESKFKEIRGLGLIDMITFFQPEKITRQVKIREPESGTVIEGYEIHHGRPKFSGNMINNNTFNLNNKVWGTYIHGIFDSYEFRRYFINRIRIKKGWKKLPVSKDNFSQDKEYNKIADLVRRSIDMKYFYGVLNGRI